MSISESRNGITFSGVLQSTGLLILRLGVGFMMIRGHGWGKVYEWADLYDRFPDPLGIGSGVTLGLVVFAEVICAILLMSGLFTRLALIPLIIDMGVAFFVVAEGDAWAQRELPMLFLIPFITLLITGPGWYSLDNIRKRRKRKAGAALKAGADVAAAPGVETSSSGIPSYASPDVSTKSTK